MIKRYVLLLALVVTTSFSFAQGVEKTDENTTTYYLIRHAEKDRSDKTNKNPGLTPEGLARAEKWSQVLENFGIDAVYSTNYNRTLHTGKPTAETNKLEIKTYHPFKIDMAGFLTDTKGKDVLIVGHSNTTASFANKLIGSEVYGDISDDNNANLYIVTIKGAKVSHVLIKMQ